MSETTQSAIQKYKSCERGETAVFTDTDGNSYSGLIHRKEGATITVIDKETNRLLELRGIWDENTLVLAIGEKIEDETKITQGLSKANPKIELIKESTTLQFDTVITEFDSEQEMHFIGN